MNYLLRGWANYFRHSAASRTFDYVGSYAFRRMEIWLRKKTRQRIRAIYRQLLPEAGKLSNVGGRGAALYHPGVATKIEHASGMRTVPIRTSTTQRKCT